MPPTPVAAPALPAWVPFTMAALKDFLGVEHDDVSQDHLIAQAAQSATHIFQRDTGRVIVRDDTSLGIRTVAVRGSAGGGVGGTVRSIMIPHLPCALVDVQVEQAGVSTTLTPVVDYRWSDEVDGGEFGGGIVTLHSPLPGGGWGMARYRPGWAPASVPADVVDCVMRITKKIRDEVSAGTISVPPMGTPPQLSRQTPIRSELPPTVQLIMSRWMDYRH